MNYSNNQSDFCRAAISNVTLEGNQFRRRLDWSYRFFLFFVFFNKENKSPVSVPDVRLHLL